MKAENLSRNELRKETRRVLKNISRRIARIDALENAPRYAVNRFREIEKNVPSRLTQLSENDLRNLYRDLIYVNRLKSSTVKGAKEVEKTFEPIARKIEELPEEQRKKVFKVYEMFYGSVGGIASHYKYEVLDYAADALKGYEDINDLAIKAVLSFDEIYRGADENATDTETKLLLSQKLKDILQ